MASSDHIETIIVDIPTIRGHVLSMTTMQQQSIVLARIRFADGSEGIGEGTTIGGMSYGPESPESIKLAIDSYLGPAILGQDGDRINQLIARMRANVRGNHIALCAVETALWDGLARRQGVSVAQLFGGAMQPAMPVAWTLASGRSDTDIAEAQRMLETRRHNIFKLKIGKRSLREDVAHVAAIRAALGDAASIRVDVNQAWSVTDARWGLAGLQEIGVDLVEQPIEACQIKALKMLTDSYEIAVMADEALHGPETAMAVAADRAADVFAVKIAQSGGLRAAAEVCAIGRDAGIGLYGGTMLEGGVGTAAALQLFATMPGFTWGTELFGPLLLTEDIITRPIGYRDFSVVLPEGPGLGVEIDPDKLEHYRRDRDRTVRIVALKS